MTSLVTNPRGLMFADLKELCHLTDGNLSRHLQVLHEAGFVEVWKGFHKNRPQTLCRITDDGRRRFLEYINVLETVVEDALNAASKSTTATSTWPRAGRRSDPAIGPALNQPASAGRHRLGCIRTLFALCCQATPLAKPGRRQVPWRDVKRNDSGA